MSSELQDTLHRPVGDLRISVTDRCNFRCTYCMPLSEYEWIDRREILSFEEITRIAAVFVSLGVEKVRLTGGEPLLRKDLEELIRQLASLKGVNDICLTTNGSLLAENAERLKAAGLNRINVSLDTLESEKFRRMTGRGNLNRVLEGIFAAREAGLRPLKINSVIERGVNDDEILDLLEFSRKNGFAIRFIEYMDVGNANNWRSEKMISRKEILQVIGAKYTVDRVGRRQGAAPAVDYRFLDDGGDMGVIASVSEPFCSSCTRARLTADGKLVTCLFSDKGFDLKTRLRSGATDGELAEMIRAVWTARKDRYSEERLEAMLSEKGYEPKHHKKIEMISLGG